MCTVLEVVDWFLRELPEQPIINDIHKTNSQFQTNMILSHLIIQQF